MPDQSKNADTDKSGPKTVGGYLASAFDMEDQLSQEIYNDYLNRDSWPAGLDKDILEKIKEYLLILIKDTNRHKQMLLDLQKRR
jgi:hypothetical protein